MTAIEWTDVTWNPLTGCAHVSPGCDGCYAARETAGRLSSHPAYEGLAVRAEGELPRFTGEIRLHPDRVDQPLRWRKPRMVFVNSMSDLFHPDVPLDFMADIWATMHLADQHVFQVLTKRPQRMAHIMREGGDLYGETLALIRDFFLATGSNPPQAIAWPPRNVWLGTSIESHQYAFRADHLRRAPAAVRFLSLEPLLGPLDNLDLTGTDWVIVGGESGPKARPMHPDWVRSIRDRCNANGIPFFFKQWGEWTATKLDEPVNQRIELLRPDGSILGQMPPGGLPGGFPRGTVAMYRVGKKYAGRELDGHTWDETPRHSAGGAA